MRTIILMAAVVASLGGCTSNKAYRSVTASTPPCLASDAGDCRDSVWLELKREGDRDNRRAPTQPVYLGLIEFDDQGALHSPDLKDAVIGEIRRLAERRPVLLVVFVHGWKHNAAASDDNVRAFSDVLRRIAWYDESICAGCAGRLTVGVYLGWRGLSAEVEPFKLASFWARKDTAHRVGADGAAEVLAELAKIRFDGDQRLHNRLIVTGHSFGGAVVYTALQQQLVRDTVFLEDAGTIRSGAADLIVLVNPAFEAERFRTLARRAGTMTYAAQQRPVLAIFTSADDTATSRAFPLGRFFGTLFESHVGGESDQRAMNRTAIGHYGRFVNHDLKMLESATSREAASGIERFHNLVCGWQDFQSGKNASWSLGSMTLSRRPERLGEAIHNPYLNVRVDPRLIENHSNIWGEAFSEFLYRFVAVMPTTTGRPCVGVTALPDVE